MQIYSFFYLFYCSQCKNYNPNTNVSEFCRFLLKKKFYTSLKRLKCFSNNYTTLSMRTIKKQPASSKTKMNSKKKDLKISISLELGMETEITSVTGFLTEYPK